MAKIDGTSSKNGYGFYAELTERIPSDYLITNKTIVDYNVYVKNNGTRFNSNNWSKWANIDSGNIFSQTGQNIASNSVGFTDALCIISGSKEIEHNIDGSKTITFEACIEKSSYGSYDPGRCYLSGTFTLTNIPRTSSVSATSGNIEEAISVSINRASNSFTHNLYYSFGSLKDVLIASGVATGYTWTLPTDLYTQIPNASYGIGTITCNTYNGSTYIGQKVCSFTAYASEARCKPNISMTVEDTNTSSIALTGNKNILIKYVSNAKVTLGVSGRNSASIKSNSIYCGNGKTIGGTSTTFNGVDSNYFKGTTTDSRGYSNSIEKTLEMIPYVKLTLNTNVYRPNQTGSEVRVKLNGNYFKGSFGAVTNTLSLKYRKREMKGTWSDYITLNPTINANNTYTLDVSLGTDFDYKSSYDFEFIVTDKVGTFPSNESIAHGIPIHAMFEKFFEYWGVKSFEISDDGTLVINGNIKISGSNKLLKNL